MLTAKTPTSNKQQKITKILIAGTGAVGKTTIVRVLKRGHVLSENGDVIEYKRTPFIELETILAQDLGKEDSENVFLMVDVAGQLCLPIHALRDLTKLAIRNVELVILIFSADSLQSLLDLRDWIELIKIRYDEEHGKSPRFILLMNKSDLEMVMDKELIERFIEAEPIIEAFFEVSCLTGQGIDNLSDWLIKYGSSVSEEG